MKIKKLVRSVWVRNPLDQQGMTLTEVMIAGAIVAVISIAFSEMVANMSRSNKNASITNSLNNLEKRVQTVVSNPKAILRTSLIANVVPGGIKNNIPPPPTPELNVCGQVKEEMAWSVANAATVGIPSSADPNFAANYAKNIINKNLFRCIDYTRYTKKPSDPTDPDLAVQNALAAYNCTNPVDPADQAAVGTAPIADITKVIAGMKFFGVQDCATDTAFWNPVYLFDGNGKEVTGYYSVEGMQGPTLSSVLLAPPGAAPMPKGFPILVQAFANWTCPMNAGQAVAKCERADTIQTAYSITMTQDGINEKPKWMTTFKGRGLNVMDVKIPGVASNVAVKVNDAKYLLGMNTILSTAGGTGGNCDLSTQIMTGIGFDGAAKCVDKSEFLKGLYCQEKDPVTNLPQIFMGFDKDTGKPICSPNKGLTDCHTVEADARGFEVQSFCYRKVTHKSTYWIAPNDGQGSCGSITSKAIGPGGAIGNIIYSPGGTDSRENGVSALNTILATRKMFSTSNPGAFTHALANDDGVNYNIRVIEETKNTMDFSCGDAGGGCGDCADGRPGYHSHNICNMVDPTKSAYQPYLDGVSPDKLVVVSQSNSGGGAMCALAPVGYTNFSTGVTDTNTNGGLRQQNGFIHLTGGHQAANTSFKLCHFEYDLFDEYKKDYQYGASAGTNLSGSCSGTGYKLLGALTSTSSVRAAIDFSDDKAEYLFAHDSLIFTFPVCAKDEIAVSGGGACPSGAFTISKPYGYDTLASLDGSGQTVTSGGSNNVFMRNWLLGCTGVTANLFASMATPPQYLRFSVNCCKNGKTDNTSTLGTGPGDHFLIGGDHTKQACIDKGGVLTNVDGSSEQICVFNAPVCPSSVSDIWNQYSNYGKLGTQWTSGGSSVSQCPVTIDPGEPSGCSGTSPGLNYNAGACTMTGSNGNNGYCDETALGNQVDFRTGCHNTQNIGQALCGCQKYITRCPTDADLFSRKWTAVGCF